MILIFLDRSLKSPVLNKIPPFPLSRISFGPVGQSLEIISLFKQIPSSNTLGKPS